MGHHPQRERPSELAQFIEAVCALPGACGAASRSTPSRRRVPAAALTPQPLTATEREPVAGRRLTSRFHRPAPSAGLTPLGAPDANLRTWPTTRARRCGDG